MKPRILIALALLAAPSVHGQTASLHGQVTDESGALVPGAKVSLSVPGSAARTTRTDGTGAYAFAGLTEGDYSVQASAPQLVQAEPVKIALKPGPQVLNLVLTRRVPRGEGNGRRRTPRPR